MQSSTHAAALPPLHVLRDYERCPAPGVCGNKARKLASLMEASALPPLLVSHGGTQSNAMLALAQLCRHRGVPMVYHTKPMPGWLRATPTGNLAAALATESMRLIEHSSSDAYKEAVKSAAAAEIGFIPQGAAWPGAEVGVAQLAREIGMWHSSQQAGRQLVSSLDVVVPAGTGTTALFLARHVPPSVRVHAVPCVGDEHYLREQMTKLDMDSRAVGTLPHILPPPPSHAVPFGAPSEALLTSWRDAATHGVFLDLLYGPVAWSAMWSRRWPQGTSSLLYINCGGQEGLASQLRRYHRAGLLDGAQPEDLLEDTKRVAAEVLLHECSK